MLLDVWRDGKIVTYHNSKGTFHVSIVLFSVGCSAKMIGPNSNTEIFNFPKP